MSSIYQSYPQASCSWLTPILFVCFWLLDRASNASSTKRKETRLETVEELVIGDYVEPVASSSNHVPMPSVALEPTQADTNDKEKAPTSGQSAAMQDQVAPPPASLDDPHHVDLIVSYDVMNEEVCTPYGQ